MKTIDRLNLYSKALKDYKKSLSSSAELRIELRTHNGFCSYFYNTHNIEDIYERFEEVLPELESQRASPKGSCMHYYCSGYSDNGISVRIKALEKAIVLCRSNIYEEYSNNYRSVEEYAAYLGLPDIQAAKHIVDGLNAHNNMLADGTKKVVMRQGISEKDQRQINKAIEALKGFGYLTGNLWHRRDIEQAIDDKEFTHVKYGTPIPEKLIKDITDRVITSLDTMDQSSTGICHDAIDDMITSVMVDLEVWDEYRDF